MTSAWAGWSRIYIPVDRYDGVHSLLLCTRITPGSSTCHYLASRKILIDQNIKKRTGLALCVLCGRTILGRYTKLQHYITHLPNTGRGEFIPPESEVKTQRTPVLDILPGPWLY
jgi:hypothetical protein